MSVNAPQPAPTPRYGRGDVVLVPFPLSAPDASGQAVKRRPALVLSVLTVGVYGFDYLLAMITTQPAPDPLIMALAVGDITGGNLTVPASFVRPAYLFAASENIITRRIGTLRADIVDEAARRAAEAITTGRA